MPGWRNGRRAGFKLQWPHARKGSSPLPGTKFLWRVGGIGRRAGPVKAGDLLQETNCALPDLITRYRIRTQPRAISDGRRVVYESAVSRS